MKTPRLALLAVGLLILAACGPAAAAGPPEINYGRDICIECGMIIEDPRFAAAYRLADGTEHKFDDLGGLVLTTRESGDLAEATGVWVSDFDEEVLIEAETAYYVPTVGVSSPMGHGILAFSDEARALAMADSLGGEVIAWAVVLELPVMDGLVGHHHGEMDGSMDDHDMHDDGSADE